MSQHYEAPDSLQSILDPPTESVAISEPFWSRKILLYPGKKKFEAIAPNFSPIFSGLEVIFMKRLPCGNLR